MTDLRSSLLAKLDRALAVCEAATPGPWWAGKDAMGTPLLNYRYEDVPTWLAEGSDHPQKHENFAFIAFARTALPLVLRALRAEVERHTAYGCYDECGHDHAESEVGSGTVVDVEDIGPTCEAGLLYSVCRLCHTDDGEIREHDYDELTGEWPCRYLQSTAEALEEMK